MKVSGKTFLSSDKFMQKNDDVFASSTGWNGRITHYMNRKGPSIPKQIKDPMFQFAIRYLDKILTQEFDFVRGLPCDCPSVLHHWKDRVRLNEWPSKEDIDIVTELSACVVPVGEKESEHEHLQLGLCFTLAEIHLIKSMNNTQTKVHVLMKLIAKHYLKPVCEDITSYIVKNVMLWLAEETPIEKYQPRYLLDRLTDALIFLTECVQHKELNNYMSPDRNMLKGKLTTHSVEALVHKLNHVIECLQIYSSMILTDVMPMPEPMQRIEIQHHNVNYFDRTRSLSVSVLTVNQLDNIYETLFYIQSGVWYKVYYFSQKLRYSIFNLGFKLFTDPLSKKKNTLTKKRKNISSEIFLRTVNYKSKVKGFFVGFFNFLDFYLVNAILKYMYEHTNGILWIKIFLIFWKLLHNLALVRLMWYYFLYGDRRLKLKSLNRRAWN